jgi:hypothetical protein
MKRTGHVHELGGWRGGGHLHLQHPLLAVRHLGVLVERPAPLPRLHRHLDTATVLPSMLSSRRQAGLHHVYMQAQGACEALALCVV